MDFGNLRGGAGGWDSNCRHLSCGLFDVPGSCLADRLRNRLLQAIGKEIYMNIVVWKSPKALRGILRRLFKVK